MQRLGFVWYDYIIFILMVGFSIVVGIYYGIFDKSNGGVSNYFYGGKQLKVLPASISLIASSISVMDLLTIPAEVYMHGTQYWVTIFSIPFMGLIVNYLYLPVIYKLTLNNIFEYYELRYGKILSRTAMIFYVAATTLFIPVLLYTPALAFSQVTGFDTHFVTWIITAICIFYTTIGGLKAVIWSDTVQFVITVATLFLSLVLGVMDLGGLNTVWKIAERGERIEIFNMDPDPTLRATFWSVFIGGIFHWNVWITCAPAATQRLLSVKTFRDSQSVLWIFCVGSIITKSIICFLGVVMYAKYSNCDPLSIGLVERADQMIPFYVLDLVNDIPGISVLFISGVFSMCFSVLSTFLNATAYLIYTDLILPLFPNMPEKRGNYVAKVLTLLLGLFCLGMVYVVENFGSMFEFTFTLGGIMAGTLFGLLLLGLIFPFANTKGAYCGGLAAFTIITVIIIKSNIYIWNGEIKYEPKPLHTDGCHGNFTLRNKPNVNASLPINNQKSQPWWLFRISFFYYLVIGSLIVVVVGLLSSIITKNNSDPPMKEELIAPIAYRLFSRTKEYKYQQPEHSSNINDEESTV